MDRHDARNDQESLAILCVPWRVGRRVSRNIYALLGEEASDNDLLIGQMDTGQLARECVYRHNDAHRFRWAGNHWTVA